MKQLLAVLFPAFALLTACAMQTDVLKVKADTYQVSATAAPARGGAGGAREIALRAANGKCAELKREIEVLDTQSAWTFPAATTITLTFACR